INGFDEAINLALITNEGKRPSQDIIASYNFDPNPTMQQATLSFTLADLTAGNSYDFQIVGYTSDSTVACGANLTISINGNGSSDLAVYTLAGNGSKGFVDGTGKQAIFGSPYGLDAHQNIIYVADANNHAIRKINENGVVNTLAGDGSSGYRNGDQPRFFNPFDIVIDTINQYAYVSDNGNLRIRRIELSTGVTISYAGNGLSGTNDGPANQATFFGPTGLAIRNDSLFIADYQNNLIRVVNLVEDPAQAVVSTYAGNGQTALVDGPKWQASFNKPVGLAFSDQADRLFVADNFNNKIRVINANTINTLQVIDADNQPMSLPYDIVFDDKGDFYVSEGSNVLRKFTLQENKSYNSRIWVGQYNASGYQDGLFSNALFNTPRALTISSVYNQNNQLINALIIADTQNHTIRYIPLE
ncbi:MAG: hypothetical protein ACNS62_08365, partial [Candidatus Cyclobacteriaceae bacterium M3_2C_046]